MGSMSITRSKRRSALTAAVVAAAAVGLFVFGRRSDGDRAPHAESVATIERCLEQMLDAAKAGDIEAYLGCFDGELRDRLKAGIAAQSAERAAAELRSGEADLKSFATHPIERPGPAEMVVRLERIYSRRHDVQRVRLRRGGDEWKIVELVPMDRVAPQIPYGTPVVPEAAESR